ncbi:4-hydroxy-tetrahydrodipicolinate reductase [Thalassobacillus pellis]|uniref:4-hydroxy-tetrahydrodipicolinate reductase n=1 Tax=Thalassobacillus pellis TaxID=748008 RepID=UPI0019621CB1|nr:4-hydroxy-tetrahydrodipicolinate reductase [Thalassobacillus pellis]MBM7552484.1 4-hydroxy-tetrahydrodipicolinate reductase [Thalassobacillus pellis]
MEIIKVIVAGPRGKMGRAALNMIAGSDNLQLAACLDRKFGGHRVLDLEDMPTLDALIYEDPAVCFSEVDADVLIDLTTPEVGYKHTKLALEHHIRPVIGTTGFTEEQLTELTRMSEEKRLGGVIAPNFAVGAVLMMQFSKWAAKHFPNVEIIERHHDQKLDAPSGTAYKTAELIREEREPRQQGHPDEKETLQGARGADKDGIKIHSVRLPGLVAHQEVVFGGTGETLTIRHDSINRESFMTGVKLSVETVMGMDVLAYGLENILE